ncbi:MAG: hypothetical protein HKUEN02_19260 [Anaerolineaceae bacterium]|nr:MAG: hypothetical protein HKUEN02_19260 [Anaerolineaceae bacterium]
MPFSSMSSSGIGVIVGEGMIVGVDDGAGVFVIVGGNDVTVGTTAGEAHATRKINKTKMLFFIT